MNSLRAIVASSIVAAVLASCPGAQAQDAVSIQQKLIAQYPLTKATADRTDIVTAGAVLVLEKDNLLMYTVTTTLPASNTYKNGKINNATIPKCPPIVCGHLPGLPTIPNVDQRKFVAGEKFWVPGIEAHDDGIVFDLLSDPYSDVRYYSTLKFPYPKGSVPSADAMMSAVAEVIKVAPSDDSASSGDDKKQPAAPASQTAQAPEQQSPMPPIAPPPPPDAPPAAPKTIEKGQTKEVVVAIFGQPSKVIKLSGKEIDVYPDMKVTYVNNKVSDVQ